MRLLLIGDGAHTGFGRVGRELASRLLARGHEVRWIAINWRGIDGELGAALARANRPGVPIAALWEAAERRLAELRDDPLTEWMIPASLRGNEMGHDLTAPAIGGRLWRGWQPEAVLVVADPLAMLERLLRDQGTLGSLPALNYVPIEGHNLPAQYGLIWQHVRPVAMSEFGRRELETLLGRPVEMIPHGVSETFGPLGFDRPGHWQGRPVTSHDDAKAALGWAGRTVVLRVDRHIRRKNYADWFAVLRPVLAAHPEVMAVAHCRPVDEEGSLWDLLSREPGAERVDGSLAGWRHPQIELTGLHDSWRGLDDDALNVLYNAADVLLTTSGAEGFGLTPAEAAAVGLPVIAIDYSALPEVVGPGGILVPPRDMVANPYASEWALPDVAAMSAALERLVSRPAERAALGEAGRRHVARFSWAAAAGDFEALLTAQAPVVA